MLYQGFYRGVVTNTDDPEMRGRIKCIISDVTGAETESAWCEPCFPVVYDGGGDFYVPQKNETVWIAFEKGNVKYPIYFGSWWSAQKTPLGTDYANKDNVRMISFANCIITMDKTANSLTINVGGGAAEIIVTNGNITINGSITLNGSMQVNGGINATGTIMSPNISVLD